MTQDLKVSSFDLEWFFDLEEVPDVMNYFYKSDIKGKLYRILYKMNESVNIKVKTPLGTSESKKTGPTVTQGGIEAALVSSNNVDVGVEETFIDETIEIKYEEIPLKPLSYMDDLMRMASNVNDAQEGNKLMEEFIGKKNLELNLTKSNVIAIGNSKERKRLMRALNKTPTVTKG